MHRIGLGGFFMHLGRTGTAYRQRNGWLLWKLRWMKEKLGMDAWLYDEDRYPSGTPVVWP